MLKLTRETQDIQFRDLKPGQTAIVSHVCGESIVFVFTKYCRDNCPPSGVSLNGHWFWDDITGITSVHVVRILKEGETLTVC